MNYTRLRILELDGTEAFDTGGDELIVLPLAGSCAVTIDGETFELEGRESVFSAVTDFAYAPRDARVEITGTRPLRAPRRRGARGGSSRATARPRTCRSSCAAPATRAARSTTSAPSRRSSATR